MERQLQELTGLLARLMPADGIQQSAISRLSLIRASQPTEPLHALHEPAVCIVIQGRKQVMLGDRVYHYDASRYLVVSVDLPVIGHVIEAAADKPYLCIRLDLDPVMLGALMLEMPASDTNGTVSPGSGMMLDPVTPELLDAVARLVRLLERPADIAILAPLVEREILYRLLTGEAGTRLRQIAHGEGKLQQVNRAIGWIKLNYDKSFSLERVAAEACMSSSALHQHFKAVTAMSPLQYQKQLRLQEARRLILGAALDAASAGFRVGYESPSQFSREYSRLFGAPPLRDAARLRATQFSLVPA